MIPSKKHSRDLPIGTKVAIVYGNYPKGVIVGKDGDDIYYIRFKSGDQVPYMWTSVKEI